MDTIQAKLTVFFEDPFWIGLFERIEGEYFSICKVTFGKEPKDGEVYDFILKNHPNLSFSLDVPITVKPKKKNPKRVQRAISRELTSRPTSTKSQLALQQQYQHQKIEQKNFRMLKKKPKNNESLCKSSKRKKHTIKENSSIVPLIKELNYPFRPQNPLIFWGLLHILSLFNII